MTEPRPGYYRTRLAKGAPWSRVLIFRPCPIELDAETFQWIDRWPHLVLLVNGEPRDWPLELNVVAPADVDRWAPAFERWPNICPISFAEYTYLSELGDWAKRYAPAAPEAQPWSRADHATIPPVF